MTEPNSMHILYVEDDPNIQTQTAKLLRREGHEVTTFTDVPHALDFARKTQPDLLLCDYKLDGSVNGLVLAKQVRQIYPACTIVMISAYTTRENVIDAMELDVDTYVIRPIEFPDLLDKVYAAVARRRAKQAPASPIITIGELIVKTSQHLVTWHGEPLDLTPIEFGILTRLVSQPGHVFTPTDLWAAATGNRLERSAASLLLKPHLSALRRKLYEGGKYPQPIHNVRGQGYQWSESASPQAPNESD